MRKDYEFPKYLDSLSIGDVQISQKSRHELPQLLSGLQYIFVTEDLRNSVIAVLKKNIIGEDSKKAGRLGLSLWEILVMGSMRLNLNTNYDMLHDLCNYHENVRGILGVHTKGVFEPKKEYGLQTIKDNVQLLDEDTLKEISELVVKAGHQLKKKEQEEGSKFELSVKTDSFVVKSNVHFPTDLNLLWDSARKCVDTLILLKKEAKISGWRKLKHWRKDLKNSYVHASKVHKNKGKDYEERLQTSVKSYLDICEKFGKKVVESQSILEDYAELSVQFLLKTLRHYHKMLDKHIDLVRRRILQGETIEHSEKIFSIFEPHVEWISKGKSGVSVELGHKTLVSTDQYRFILDHEVMLHERDQSQVIPLSGRIKERFEGYAVLKSISFDRGFHSILGEKAAEKVFETVIMPQKGKKSQKQEIKESDPEYIKLRHKHSAVESNINELEHSGLDKVPDKGLKRFKNYVALGVLAHNIKVLGKILIEEKVQVNKGLKKAA